MRPPIIFTGMHRSGTSMIGRMLEELGLFVGLRKDENNEALFFQEMNEWLLHQCGASWDDPTQLREYFWRNEAVVDWTDALPAKPDLVAAQHQLHRSDSTI